MFKSFTDNLLFTWNYTALRKAHASLNTLAELDYKPNITDKNLEPVVGYLVGENDEHNFLQFLSICKDEYKDFLAIPKPKPTPRGKRKNEDTENGEQEQEDDD
jgi:hypothetical protein